MTLRNRAATLFVLVSTAGLSLAQPYPDSDPRSTQYNEYQRRQQEQKQEKDRADKLRNEESAAQSAASYQQFMGNQHKLQDKLSGEVERDRATFAKAPALPAERNRLLGKWRLDKTKKAPANALAELNAMISAPACEMAFGDGIWDFRPQALYSNDAGIGEQMLAQVEYRGNDGVVAVLPKTFMRLLVFEIKGPDRVQEMTSTRIGADACVFVRVGGNASANAQLPTTRPANEAPAGASSAPPERPVAAPPAQVATVAPPPPKSARPPPEVCRQNLLDKLGQVGVNQVRAMSDARFAEAAIEGKVPNSANLRLDLRGSACDDPRIKATLYDFDANGMLQSITYVWDRPAGPAPAPIFSERIATLSRFHALPPPQSPSRLQADTSLGRLIIEDLPDRNLLLEAYKAAK